MVDGGSDGGSTAVAGSIDYDQRRMAEVDQALAAGNVKAARKAANEIRGRKAQKDADLKIEEYEAAHKAGEVPV